MARTSLKALEIPEGVTLENNQGVITFTGKLGNLSLEIHEDVDINKDEGSISFSPNKETKESLAITGTMRALTANCCLLYTSPSPRDRTRSRMPSSA